MSCRISTFLRIPYGPPAALSGAKIEADKNCRDTFQTLMVDVVPTAFGPEIQTGMNRMYRSSAQIFWR